MTLRLNRDDHATHPVCLAPGTGPVPPRAAPRPALHTPRAPPRARPPTPCRASPAPCHWPRA